MRIETKTRVSEYELQMAEKPEDIIDYVKQRNNREVSDKIAVLLKDKKPLVMYLEIDGKLIHFDNTDDCFICTTALCQKVNYCENCPHGIPNEYYVICKRDNRKMSPYDFCSLSTDSDLYHPIGIGTIYKWGREADEPNATRD